MLTLHFEVLYCLYDIITHNMLVAHYANKCIQILELSKVETLIDI